MAYIISADKIKERLEGYDPKHSELFHKESAKLADKEYASALKARNEPRVILMSGGTASGKSEYVSAYLEKEDAIVFDGTLPTFYGAEIKIRNALKSGKSVEVHCILPRSLLTAFLVFLNRDRQFPAEHFLKTHYAARKALLEITDKISEVSIKVIISSVKVFGSNAEMDFQELKFDNRGDLIEYLKQNQYTEDSIKQIILNQ